jgi:hypothetical protein
LIYERQETDLFNRLAVPRFRELTNPVRAVSLAAALRIGG